MTEYRLVVEPGEGGVPQITRVPVVQFKLTGAAETEPSPEEARDDLMLALRDAGVGPEPVLSLGADGETDARLDWPDLGTHALDPDYARLLTLASVPLGRVVPELDATLQPDPEHEAEVERIAHQDRLDHAAVVELAEAVARIFHTKRSALRRMSRSRRKKVKPKPPVIYDGERERTGDDWHWTRFVPDPRRARARIRRPRDRR